MTTGSILPAGHGRTLTSAAVQVTFKITSPHTTVGSLFELVVPPGFDVGAHLHVRAEEFFYVLEGEADMFAFTPVDRTDGDWRTWRCADGRQVVRGGPGAVLHVPPGCPHAFANPGPGPARLLFGSAPPPDHERYFEELFELLANDGPVAPGAVKAVRERYDIRQLTPLRAPGIRVGAAGS
ncbi:cupin domain-containing protein [Lentzea roselyniae]|uniref:Cupin domain-containing protein n=1 Tax=Lentzea roselyniae TaxID=531940 RepID=A0ABP7AYG3_9PSEU